MTAVSATFPARARRSRLEWICVGFGGALLVAAITAVFCLPADALPGSPRADLGQQFLAWRAFAAANVRAGHWPFWNPYCYAGEPFLAGFQSALFYPPNAVFLALPLCRAVNLSIFLHLFLLGWGLWRWARRRGLHPLAAGLAALALPLSGPVFPHVYAGHLSNLCALAWTPWVLGWLEAWAENRRAGIRPLLFAAAAVCLQILAGQPQYVFYTAVAALLQAATLWFRSNGPRSAAPVPAAAAAYLGGAALAALQLIPGIAAAAESLRQSGLDPAFAAQFSFPPENFLTAIAPGFFGTGVRTLYWGRSYAWEMSVFVGVAGLVLIGLAAAGAGRRPPRRARADIGIAAGLLLLALGAHTPLFRLLNVWVPGFDLFRGWSKFTFPAVVFLTLAIAAGADALIAAGESGAATPMPRERPARLFRRAAWTVLPAGGLAAGAGLALLASPARIAPLLLWVRASGESYLPVSAFANPAALRTAGLHAGGSLAAAGALSLLIGLCLLWAEKRPVLRWIVLALLPAELFAFAAGEFAHFREPAAVSPELRAFVAAHPGAYRVQNLVEPNNGYLIGAPDLWGNDPGLLKRYAQFIAFTQGCDPARATQNVTFRSPSALYALLRLRYVFTRTDSGWHSYEIPAPMGRLHLVTAYRVVKSPDAAFAAMARPDFDPRRTVLLESEPMPRPVPSADPGTARVVDASPDAFTVDAEVTGPALLLVTDAYSRDWHARALPGDTQRHYEIMPADYAVRATPLAPGLHRIRFEYKPSGLRAGLALSAIAWAAWLAAMAATGFGRRTRSE
ncbi:MAG: hypothetical protein ACREFX_06060 [Opitutaceae bacterium]